jgi:hypothetical protein
MSARRGMSLKLSGAVIVTSIYESMNIISIKSTSEQVHYIDYKLIIILGWLFIIKIAYISNKIKIAAFGELVEYETYLIGLKFEICHFAGEC